MEISHRGQYFYYLARGSRVVGLRRNKLWAEYGKFPNNGRVETLLHCQGIHAPNDQPKVHQVEQDLVRGLSGGRQFWLEISMDDWHNFMISARRTW